MLVQKAGLSVCFHFICLSIQCLSSYSSPKSTCSSIIFCPILLATIFRFGL